MPKASVKPSPKAALAVVELDQLTPDQMCTTSESGAHLTRLGKRAREEIDAIERIETEIIDSEKKIAQRRQENAIRSLLVGVVLHQIKTALGHGKFRKWQGEHLKVKYRQATYLMRLSALFVRVKGVLLPEVLALPQTTLDLTGGPKEAASALKKARAFVGNRSLNELLELHGIKIRGGYHPSEVAVAKWLAGFHNLPEESLAPYVYTLPGDKAVTHAFRVASGLDSLVLGEAQILGHMK